MPVYVDTGIDGIKCVVVVECFVVVGELVLVVVSEVTMLVLILVEVLVLVLVLVTAVVTERH